MKNKEKKSLLQRLLDIGLIVAGLIFVFSLIFMVSEYMDAQSGFYSANSFMYRMEDGDYPTMVRYRHDNPVDPKKEAELSEYYAVADYYEAASFYKMHLENGDLKKSELFKKKMDKAASEMGTFAAEKAKIDAVFGL